MSVKSEVRDEHWGARDWLLELRDEHQKGVKLCTVQAQMINMYAYAFLSELVLLFQLEQIYLHQVYEHTNIILAMLQCLISCQLPISITLFNRRNAQESISSLF